jgi:glucosamine--fructose-6-phosphate aminotransferase (isomerizing)
MCGVIGFVGEPQSAEFLFDGLKKLEYRGYDSAGIAMIADGEVYVQRAEGKLNGLRAKLKHMPEAAGIGMGHTRWATHGKPTEINAHPHTSRHLVLLHNGIIENFRELRERVEGYGYSLKSETDTEVAAHLLDHLFSMQSTDQPVVTRMENAIRALTKELRGSYAFGILCPDEPSVLFAVKMGSPVVLGRKGSLSLMASGMTALVEHTQDILVMEDGEYALLSKDQIVLKSLDGNVVEREPQRILWNSTMIEKGGFRHFMLKEIHDQPTSLGETLTGRVDRESGLIKLNELGLESINFKTVQAIHVIACGTSYYAGLLARYFIEETYGIPVQVELASEYRYKAITSNDRFLAIAISQSGETADTLQAIKLARSTGAQTIALVNVPGSSIGHACHAESLMRAGPEIGVASTKAFTAQVMSLSLIALAGAQEVKRITPEGISKITESLFKVPRYIETLLGQADAVEKIALLHKGRSSMLFIGRGPQYPVALEGALKLKELSYIHAEGYAAGELKHGPIALIDENMAVFCICPSDRYREKTISNIEEIRARGGHIIGLGSQGDTELRSLCHEFIEIPRVDEVVLPYLTAVPIQLFAYWVAVHKGTDVDQPRNLAKSVTVE